MEMPTRSRTTTSKLPTVLRIEGLAKSFDDKPLFHGLSMTVDRGKRWAVLGPNGSGKTTLLRIVRGLDRADAGTVGSLQEGLRSPESC
jgi:ABC-type multidrug transport system ATPase subunit